MRLEALVAACGRRGVAALPHDAIRELALLYRQTAADLSTAREDPGSAPLAQHLNRLLGRAHNLIYAGRRARPAGMRVRADPRNRGNVRSLVAASRYFAAVTVLPCK